jgi:HK97 family phage prohead protease
VTYTGKALQGCAVKYNTSLWLSGGYKVLLDGAFDSSLRSGSTIGMWLQHNPNLVFGDSKSNLILESDDYGLWFRVHLRTDTISKHVVALAESKAFTEVSVGFSYRHSDSEIRTISGREVVIIKKATLAECSLLEAGACPATNASLVEADKCGALFEDCRSLRMVNDNAFDDVMRKLRRLQ